MFEADSWDPWPNEWWGERLTPVPGVNLPMAHNLFKCANRELVDPTQEVQETSEVLDKAFRALARSQRGFIGRLMPDSAFWAMDLPREARHVGVHRLADGHRFSKELLRRKVDQLTPEECSACKYHQVDWRAVCLALLQAWRSRAESPGPALDALSEAERRWGHSLVENPIALSISGWHFNGQHRGCAIRRQEVPYVLIEVH